MTKTNRDELKSTNDNELPWMAKGSQSSTRHDGKAIVRVADSDVENKDKSSSGTVAKDSEPGKLLGQHVAERPGRVPMKKRRTMVPSTSPGKPSGGRGFPEHGPKINHVSKLDPKNDSSGHDFSGIAMLADAACNLSNDRAPAVDRLPAKETVVQQHDVSTIFPHAVDSTDQVVQGKMSQKSSFGLADEKGIEHITASVGGMVEAAKGASESENFAPDNGVGIKSEKSLASGPTEKKNSRLHWDLNVFMDAWGPPCDLEDDASEEDVKGEVTKPMPPRESEPIDGSKDHLDEFVVSAGQQKFSSTCGPKAKAAARNGNEFKSGYSSPLEDGELREPYHWRKNKIEDGESEQEDEGFYPMAESNDNKMKDSGKGIFERTKLGPLKCKSHDALRIGEAHDRRNIEKNVGACMNDFHLEKRSSSSRRFASKQFKEFPSYDTIPRTRSDDYEELGMDPYKSSGRHDKSSGRGYFSGSGSRPRYVFEPPHPNDQGMMGGFDQSGSWSEQGSQPDGYVRKRFSNGGYRGGRFRRSSNGRGQGMMGGFDQSGSWSEQGSQPDGHVRKPISNGGYRGGRFRRFSNGGDRALRGRHGDNSQFSGRMHSGMSGNKRQRGSSPVFRRSRSPSPAQWNGRDTLSPPHDGFRAEERMVERGAQKRFVDDQEMGFVSPPRNRMPSPRFIERRSNDFGANHNSFRERRFGLADQRYDAGSSWRRLNSDNCCNYIPFRRQRTFDAVEDSTGGNKFEMRQQQTRRADVTEDGSDDFRQFSPKRVGGYSQQQRR